MSLKQLLIVVLSATVIFWLSWLFILLEVDPTAGWIGLLFFYSSLFFSLLGTLFIFFTVLRRYIKKGELEQQLVAVSFRQSIFFSLTIVGVLFLQNKRFLTWWNLIILVLAFTLLEYLALSLKRKPVKKTTLSDSTPYLPPDF